MDNKQLKAMAASYGRSILASVLALYMAGVTDPKDLWAALAAALAPVALRAINPNDKAFGVLPAADDVEEALKAVKVPAKRVVKPKTKKK